MSDKTLEELLKHLEEVKDESLIVEVKKEEPKHKVNKGVIAFLKQYKINTGNYYIRNYVLYYLYVNSIVVKREGKLGKIAFYKNLRLLLTEIRKNDGYYYFTNKKFPEELVKKAKEYYDGIKGRKKYKKRTEKRGFDGIFISGTGSKPANLCDLQGDDNGTV